MNRAIDTVLRYIILIAIFGTLFVPLVTAPALFFPYITGKAFVFRLLVELALFAYIALLVRDTSYLPRKNALLWSTLAFVVVLGLSTVFSVNPARSFWSNFERMEGFVTILHLFALFIVAGSAIRTKEMWFALVNISLVASLAVGVAGFMDYKGAATSGSVRIAGALGNSTYLGVYALVHVFLSGLMLSTLSKAKKLIDAPGRYLAYLALLIFNLLVVYNTGTRGSVVGIGVGVFLITLLLAIFERKNITLRKTAIGILVFVLVVVGTLGAAKESAFVKKNDLLYRFSSLITFDIVSVLENQGRSRTLLWGIASDGVKERPLLGWGQDNFGYVFAKYYDPKIYDQEQWFDRTHNVFMDWLIAAGFLGLLSYLSLFVVALYLLWKRSTNSDTADSEFSLLDKSIVTGLLAAYFVHNLFVFDNLVSYILFFLLLAYIYDRSAPSRSLTEKKVSYISDDGVWAVVAVVLLAVVSTASYYAVLKPYLTGRTLIQGMLSFQEGAERYLGPQVATPEGKLQYFKDALSYNTFAQQEIDERLAELTPSLIAGSKDEKMVAEVLQFMQTEFTDLIEKNTGDPRPAMFYGAFLQKVGLYDESFKYLDQAIALSPNKQSIYYQKGVSLMAAKKPAEAVIVFKKALDLLPENKEAKIYYGISLVFAGRIAEAKVLYGDDLTILTDPRVLQVLDDAKLYDYIVEIAEKKVAVEPNNPQHLVSLASAYLKASRPKDAIVQLRKAIVLAPQFKEQGEYYIREIESGRNPAK